MSNYEYKVDYALSGRSSCKECKKSIDKDEMRIGILKYNPFGEGKMTHYYHVNHAFDVISRMRETSFKPTKISDFEGYKNLAAKDKSKISKQLKKKSTGKSKAKSNSRSKKTKAKSKSKSKAKSKSNSKSKTKKTKAKSKSKEKKSKAKSKSKSKAKSKSKPRKAKSKSKSKSKPRKSKAKSKSKSKTRKAKSKSKSKSKSKKSKSRSSIRFKPEIFVELQWSDGHFSDEKFWNFTLSNGKKAEINYGLIDEETGKTYKTKTNIKKFRSEKSALKYLKSKLAEKERKGYKSVRSNVSYEFDF
jgi:predicted DNA-binding WGR domain protein